MLTAAEFTAIKERVEDLEEPIVEAEGYDPDCDCGEETAPCSPCLNHRTQWAAKRKAFERTAYTDVKALIETLDALEFEGE